jgi:hypothetical protein
MKSAYNMATKYFKSEEGKETLGGTFDGKGALETRTYKYRTGAVY